MPDHVAGKKGARMRTCPYCGQEALSFWRKSFLGPARTAACGSCGRRISVAWLGILGVVPLFAGMMALAWSGGSWLGILALVLGVLGTFAFHEWLVPLVRRDG